MNMVNEEVKYMFLFSFFSVDKRLIVKQNDALEQYNGIENLVLCM